MPVVPRFVRNPWLWGVGALLLAAYAAAGFWLVPRLVQQGVHDQLASRYHREATLRAVRFNPFTFEFTAEGFAIPDADGRRLLAFDRLYVNFELASLFRGGYQFAAIELDRPVARLVRRADGRVNVMDLAPPPDPAAKPAEPATIPRLWIDELAVSAGEIEIVDLARRTALHARFTPVTFRLRDFSTASEGNAYALKALSTAGEGLAWAGTFGLEPLASQGTFELSRIRAATISEIGLDLLPLAITKGELGLKGSYSLASDGGSLAVRATVQELVCTDVGLRAIGATEDWVTLPRVAITDTRLDVAARTVDVGHVAIERPAIAAWLGPKRELNLLQLVSTRTVPADEKAAATPEDRITKPWTLSVPDVRITGADVRFEDRSLKAPARMRLQPLDLTVGNYALPARGPLAIELGTGVNGDGRLQARGEATLEPVTAKLAIEARALDLTPLQPYLEGTTALTVKSGQAELEADVAYDAKGMHLAGDARVLNLRTVDDALEQDFVKWQSVAINGLDLRSAPFGVKIREIVARQPYLRVIVASDQTLNLTAVLAPEAAAAAARERAAAAKGATGTTPESDATVAATDAAANAPKAVRTSTSKPVPRRPRKGAEPPPAPPAPRRESLPVEIGTVRIVDGSMNFADFSIRPNFATGIQALNGTIKGLSGRDDARADVTLDGKVDRYAPVKITGKVNYFAAVGHTDVKFAFRNMELTSFSPYSGKFAGYRIDKGKLSVDFAYLIENRKLQASHRLIIDQLQLGEKVDSTDATHLPVKLAIALLKDRNGVIDLDLPVTGSLDDPKFRLGPIIWKVVVNLITKIVTSPFALLGSLFGGGDDMQYVDFKPGVATLDDAARQKLAGLVKALDSRPALSLDVPMTANAGADRAALVQARWTAQLHDAAAAELGKRAGEPGAIDALLADPARRRDLLVRLYRTQTGNKPQIPDPPAAAAGAPAPDKAGAAIAWLEGELKPRVTVPDTELEALGRARAAAVQAALLEGTGIDPSRVFVITAPAQADAKDSVRMQLALR